MKLIIQIKDTATLVRIADLGNHLEKLNKTPRDNTMSFICGYDDVIEEIRREW